MYIYIYILIYIYVYSLSHLYIEYQLGVVILPPTQPSSYRLRVPSDRILIFAGVRSDRAAVAASHHPQDVTPAFGR